MLRRACVRAAAPRLLHPALRAPVRLERIQVGAAAAAAAGRTDMLRVPRRAAQTAAASREHSSAVAKTPEELIAEVPPVEVDGLVARCDGGGRLGHPVEYIQLNTVDPHEPQTCKYCGLRFVAKKH